MTRSCAAVMMTAGLVWASVWVSACSYSRRMAEAIPEAASYSNPVHFEGRWRGNIGDYPGELRLQKSPSGKYRGRFVAWRSQLRYELSATRDLVPDSEPDKARNANRLLFEWKDLNGGRGKGWLLISPDGQVLTGEYGFGDSAIGAGDWSFLRAQAAKSAPM